MESKKEDIIEIGIVLFLKSINTSSLSDVWWEFAPKLWCIARKSCFPNQIKRSWLGEPGSGNLCPSDTMADGTSISLCKKDNTYSLENENEAHTSRVDCSKEKSTLRRSKRLLSVAHHMAKNHKDGKREQLLLEMQSDGPNLH